MRSQYEALTNSQRFSRQLKSLIDAATNYGNDVETVHESSDQWESDFPSSEDELDEVPMQRREKKVRPPSFLRTLVAEALRTGDSMQLNLFNALFNEWDLSIRTNCKLSAGQFRFELSGTDADTKHGRVRARIKTLGKENAQKNGTCNGCQLDNRQCITGLGGYDYEGTIQGLTGIVMAANCVDHRKFDYVIQDN